jgi:glycosyltransferase involved in cell wall biosynthesis
MFGATRRVEAAARRVNADVYHFHDPELIPVGISLKRWGKTVIFDAHEDVAAQMLSKPYLNALIRRLLAWAYAYYESRRCREFVAIVAATPTIRDKYQKMHGRVVNINNFPMAEEIPPVHAWSTKERSVCYVGGICRIRGIIEIISSLSLTRGPMVLHLAGGFSDSEGVVRGLPGWERVISYGHLGRDGVRGIFDKSLAGLILLHPEKNHIEALPTKMFEYMSAGIPVIASDFPLWRDIIEGENCGVCVDPLDPSAIARAIDMLANNRSLAEKMGNNGRRSVVERYNWFLEEKKLIKLYADIECRLLTNRQRI